MHHKLTFFPGLPSKTLSRAESSDDSAHVLLYFALPSINFCDPKTLGKRRISRNAGVLGEP